jgi:hypothetical protein
LNFYTIWDFHRFTKVVLHLFTLREYFFLKDFVVNGNSIHSDDEYIDNYRYPDEWIASTGDSFSKRDMNNPDNPGIKFFTKNPLRDRTNAISKGT